MHVYPFLSRSSRRCRFHSYSHTLEVLPYSQTRIACLTGAYLTHLLLLQTRALLIMPTEFSLFSSLPTELREEIWNLAIRPKYLGVHIFRVYNTNLDHETPPQEVIHFSRNKCCRRERHELDLAVPLAGKELEGANDPSAKSMSAYMIDTGLWTACHESRVMVIKAFPTIKNTRDGKDYLKPEVGYYLSGGAPYYFTIKPMSNPFVLRPDSVYFDLEQIDPALSHGIWKLSASNTSQNGDRKIMTRAIMAEIVQHSNRFGNSAITCPDHAYGSEIITWNERPTLLLSGMGSSMQVTGSLSKWISWEKVLGITGSILNQFRMEITSLHSSS